MQKDLKNSNNEKGIFVLLLLLVFLDRFFLLINFSFKYVGSDDLIFWQSATDYMHGTFHEPYFYGQNYNFMLESLFAIPFLKLGIPYHYTFPIITSLISLFPFLLFSTVLFKKKILIEALFFLIIPISLPIEYGILTSITRGFVTGIFFSSFLIFPLLNPTKKSNWIIAAFSLSLGYIFNPNSLIFSIPACLYIFLNNYKNISFYLINLVVILPILSIEYFAKNFYFLNKDYNVCSMWSLGFDYRDIIANFNHLDIFFNYVSPVFWFAGWLILIILLFIGIFLIKKDWKIAISILIGILFIIITLGINKVNDHLDTIFLSSTRMYLAIPLFTGLVFLWGINKFLVPNKYIKAGIIIIAICTFCLKSTLLSAVIKKHTTITNYGAVAIKKIQDLKCECNEIKSIAIKNNVNLIIYVPDGKLNVPAMEFYDYGCPLIENDFPKTMLTVYEKRTWVYLKEKYKVEKNILIYGSDQVVNNLKVINNYEIISTNPNIILIKNNTIDTESLLGLFNIELKRNSYN